MTWPMWRPNNFQWWLLLVVVSLIVFVWPPPDAKSLAVQTLNWAVDPWDELPILPGPLVMGEDGDQNAVDLHDALTSYYDALYLKGGWTRRRLELKVAGDPFNPATERVVLTGIAVVTALLVWRWSGRRN